MEQRLLLEINKPINTGLAVGVGGRRLEKKTVVEKSGQNFVLTPCTEMDAEL